MAARRFHRNRKVRLHRSGLYVCTIGRTLSERSGRFVDKDWYFKGNEAEATKKANAKATQWELLCENWHKTEQPFLAAVGDPMPAEPRWPAKAGKAQKVKVAQEVLQEMRREGVIDAEEMAQAYAEFTFAEMIPVYENDRATELRTKEVRNSTISKDVSQMRQVAKYLPADIPVVDISAVHFRDAKRAMFAAGRKARTVRNYLSLGVKLLRWVYGRYGGGTRLPPGIEDAITVRRAVKTNIVVHSVEELKALMGKVKGTLCELDCLLALNCGMYPADIGRLKLDEIDLQEGSVFWDREKEPENDFRVHHVLWPETLTAIKRYVNDGVEDAVFDDYLHDREEPEKVHTRELAFLDSGRPRYLTKPGGSAYDLVGRRWGRMKTCVQIHNLRKSTNEFLVRLMNEDSSGHALTAVEEISDQFLGQGTDLLVRLYRTSGKHAYARMNRFLERVGEHLRTKGVFEPLSE